MGLTSLSDALTISSDMPLSPESLPTPTLVSGLPTLQDAGLAFDPNQQAMDLTKDEKRRTTALFMAIHAYNNLIIKDAEMYNAVARDRDRGTGPRISEATMDAMVEAAVQFDDFISGRLQQRLASSEDEPEVDDATIPRMEEPTTPQV